MGNLPEFVHENSNNISVRQINKFGGYNHNKVIPDYDFFDMENVNGADYPALSVRNGRSIYEWNISIEFLETIRIGLCIMYSILYSAYIMGNFRHDDLLTMEEYFASKNCSYLLSQDTYIEYIKTEHKDLYETYISGKYNGCIDFDGLCIVKGNFLYFKSYPICEVSDSKKILVPIGDKIAIFPDKKIVDIVKVNEAISCFIDKFQNYSENNVSSGIDEVWNSLYTFCLEHFKDCISFMDAERNYIGLDSVSLTENLIKNTDFSGVNAEFSHVILFDNSIDDIWYMKVQSGSKKSIQINNYNDDVMGQCVRINNNGSTVYGLYQRVKYIPGSNITFKLSFYARRDDNSDIVLGRSLHPYISEGTVHYQLGKSVYVDTEWKKFEITKNITVPPSGEFIVSIDSGSETRCIYIAKPECCRVLTDAEASCCIDMTHYTLSAYTVSDNLAKDPEFSNIGAADYSGINSIVELSDAWKIKCTVGANTTLSVGYDEIHGGSMYYKLSNAATVNGIYQNVAYNQGTYKVRMSFYAKADNSSVPIKPYINDSNSIAVNSGKTVYLNTEWQKITVEKTVTIDEDGYFTVSLDGIAAGSARKVWFSDVDVVIFSKKDISTDFKVLDAVHLKVEYAYNGNIFEAEHDAVIYDISDDGSVLTFNDYALLALFPQDCIIYEKQADGSTMSSLSLGDSNSVMLSNLEISRISPKIDFACSCHNKVWGVNNKENVIYASYYNDATNWNFFEGIAADSFYGECTTPGRFTAAVAYNGYPLFFKERYLATVYGNDSKEFVIQEKEFRGVEEKSENAIVCVNETLYYKSLDGIMRFAGGLPVSIGESFGSEQYHSAVLGADYSLLYASMLDKNNEAQLFVYDTEKMLWYKEDPIRADDFVFCDQSLKIIDAESGDTIILNDPDSEELVRWFVETSDFYEGTPAKKYVWQLIMRIGLETNSSLKVFLQYNSSGKWELVKEIKSTGKKSYSIPLQCKRSDHLKMRIEGKGKATIYTIAKRLITGSYI